MRSALLVRGDDEALLAEAIASGADAVIVDLTAAIPDSARASLRRTAAAFLRAGRALAPAVGLLARVNGLESGQTDDDLDAVMPAAPWGIVLPGSLGAASVQQLGVKLAVREALGGLADGATRIVAIAADSAQALSGLDSYRGCSARLAGLAWDGNLPAKDIGAEGDAPGAGPVALARNLTLMAAAAARVTPIDAPFAEARDPEGLRAEAAAARRDGFRAKLAFHPAQVAIINEVFGAAPAAAARAPIRPRRRAAPA